MRLPSEATSAERKVDMPFSEELLVWWKPKAAALTRVKDLSGVPTSHQIADYAAKGMTSCLGCLHVAFQGAITASPDAEASR